MPWRPCLSLHLVKPHPQQQERVGALCPQFIHIEQDSSGSSRLKHHLLLSREMFSWSTSGIGSSSIRNINQKPLHISIEPPPPRTRHVCPAATPRGAPGSGSQTNTLARAECCQSSSPVLNATRTTRLYGRRPCFRLFDRIHETLPGSAIEIARPRLLAPQTSSTGNMSQRRHKTGLPGKFCSVSAPPPLPRREASALLLCSYSLRSGSLPTELEECLPRHVWVVPLSDPPAVVRHRPDCNWSITRRSWSRSLASSASPPADWRGDGRAHLRARFTPRQ